MAIGDISTFNYTGAVQTMQLLAGKRYLLKCWGAQGGSWGERLGGKGGFACGVIKPTLNKDLHIYVGGSNGWNGGGGGDCSGGGASDIRIDGTNLNSRIIVAAGGGGASSQLGDGISGAGGGLTGLDGYDFWYGHGDGATQSAGGAPNGVLGQGGGSNGMQSGGGGGGYYGGGGSSGHFGCGGGGSSYLGSLDAAFTQAMVRTGNGLIEVIELDPEAQLITEPLTYNFTGEFQSVFLKAGRYSLDLFGACGGYSNTNNIPGSGGRSYGEIELLDDTTLGIFVGGKSTLRSPGWNGGGTGGGDGGTGGGGGGASDIRIGNFTDLASRIIVAGGGGGSSNQDLTNGLFGHGGGLTGVIGRNLGGQGQDGRYAAGEPGEQDKAGQKYVPGSLGLGGNGGGYAAGAGGGGYYGGGGGGDYAGGGGGSSYLGSLENAFTEVGVNLADGYIIITPLSGKKPRRYSYVI